MKINSKVQSRLLPFLLLITVSAAGCAEDITVPGETVGVNNEEGGVEEMTGKNDSESQGPGNAPFIDLTVPPELETATLGLG